MKGKQWLAVGASCIVVGMIIGGGTLWRLLRPLLPVLSSLVDDSSVPVNVDRAIEPSIVGGLMAGGFVTTGIVAIGIGLVKLIKAIRE